MYVLVRKLCVFILAAYLKRSEVLARLEQPSQLFLYCGKVFIVHS
ncbi:MAG: hypothetical protein ACI95X_002934 [Paraglaciecola sp.]|jgi:hypothetical protein